MGASTEPITANRAEVAEPQDSRKNTQTPLRAHVRNIALITFAVVALFWRVFFLGETLIDLNTLNNQLPWGYYAGQHSDHPYNRRDLTDMYVTREYFVVAAWRDGEMPLWNPYTMAGHPIYADGVTRIFSPFLLFYTFLDVPLGYSVVRITELLLAAIFMYLFLVGIGVGPRGGLMGSLVFAFSAHSMLHVEGLGWWGGFLWLPLIFLFVDRAARGSYPSAIVAGVFLAAQFFWAYMPNQIYYVGATALYYLFFALKDRSRAGRILAMLGITLVVGLALSATQWAPIFELLKHSNRRIVPTEVGYIYLPPWYLATLVFPNLFGAAYDVKTIRLFTALNVSHDHILYLGIAALAPLGYLIYSRTKKPPQDQSQITDHKLQITFFAFLALFSLAVMMTAPLYVHVTKYLPVLQTIRVIVRAGVLFLFAASALVAFGTDRLLAADAGRIARFSGLARRFLFAAVVFVLAGVAASYTFWWSGITVSPDEKGKVAFIKKTAGALSAQFTPPDMGILIPLACLLLAVLLLRWLAYERLSRRAFFACLVALLLADLFWNSQQFNPTFDSSRVYPRTQITDTLRSLPPGRVLVTPSGIDTNRRADQIAEGQKIIAPPNTLLPYQIASISGKNQLFPRRYREFCSLIEPQSNLSHVVFEQSQSPFFDLLNVRYVLTHATRPAPPNCSLLMTAEGLSLYENPNALPRSFFVERVMQVQTPEESMNALRAPAFDPRTTAIIEGGSPLQMAESGKGAAEIIEEKRNSVRIATDNVKDGILILSDNFYPGWRASVDGVAVEIFRANYTMRAVKVPAGRHVVSFEFAPEALRRSALASLASAAVVGLCLVVLTIRGRRQKRKAEE